MRTKDIIQPLTGTKNIVVNDIFLDADAKGINRNGSKAQVESHLIYKGQLFLLIHVVYKFCKQYTTNCRRKCSPLSRAETAK